MPTLTVLLVDDYEPFRRIVRVILQQRDGLQVIGEASDGLEAVQKAKELQPDLILLDIGLPKLNGIQVARRLRDLVPRAKVLFLSEESHSDIVQEGLRSGALGYVHKLNTQRELLPAIEAVLKDTQFVGGGLDDDSEAKTPQLPISHHNMLVYSDDGALLNSVAGLVSNALNGGNPAIVVATQSHREGLLQRLKERGFDTEDAIKDGILILMDAVKMLSTFIVNGMPDRVAFFEAFGALVESAAKAARTEHSRVTIYGEGCGRLYAEGNFDAAISVEKIASVLAKTYNIDILCSYPSLHDNEVNPAFKAICGEHSAVSRE